MPGLFQVRSERTLKRKGWISPCPPLACTSATHKATSAPYLVERSPHRTASSNHPRGKPGDNIVAWVLVTATSLLGCTIELQSERWRAVANAVQRKGIRGLFNSSIRAHTHTSRLHPRQPFRSRRTGMRGTLRGFAGDGKSPAPTPWPPPPPPIPRGQPGSASLRSAQHGNILSARAGDAPLGTQQMPPQDLGIRRLSCASCPSSLNHQESERSLLLLWHT